MRPYYDEGGITIYHGTCREHWPIDDGAAACVVTSPPYNVDMNYDTHDDVMSWDDYSELASIVSLSTDRVLMVGGRMWVNVTPVVPAKPIAAGDHSGRGRNPRVPLLGLWMTTVSSVAELHIWDVVAWPSPRGPGTAWGSWKSPAGPNLRGNWEAIIVACKTQWARETPEQWRGWRDGEGNWTPLTSNVWTIQPQRRKPDGHPAPFPTALPERAIRLSSWPDELIVDPFAGSGSTLVAAAALGRRAVGFELSERYCEIAANRLRDGIAARLDFDESA